MGLVYEAEDVSLKRMVALKFLNPDLTRNPEARERFVQEAQAASGLDHPNICTIHEIGQTESGEMYIAMACYKGENLKDVIERGPLPPSDVIDIAAQVAEGLAKAHEKGIVHRDIKPGNIFLASDGPVKILDFGLAKLADQMKWTLPGMTLGTVAYMSPEQVRGEDVDARTDVWSLGVVLYEMATGTLPFRGEKERAVFNAILNNPPLPAKDLRPGFPAEIEGIISKALDKEPARRFSTAREMAEALQNLKKTLIMGSRSALRRLSFGRSRRKMTVVSAASLLTLAAIGTAVWLLTRPALAFENRDKLMVADVDNKTGDKVFDLALRTAIEADLQQSPYAAIFDRPQIAETLRLMRMDPNASVDEAVGYDVCRFAGVRAFVLPRILGAGEAYELEAILIDPGKRRHVDRIRVTAKGREDVLLHGIDKLAGKVRSRLGESLSSIQKANKTVAQVTTSSWEALDYFSRGVIKWQRSKMKDAAALFELALESDPKFVDARSSLGLLCCQFLGEQEKGKAFLRQALKDAEGQSLSQRDILKLRAANKQFVDGDLPGALEEYRIMREVFPDFMPPWNNSGMILRSLGRYDEAVKMYEKAADLAPRNSIPLMNLWFTLLDYLKDAKATENVARRLVALSPDFAQSRGFLGYSLAAQGHFDEAEKELRKTLELEPDHAYALPNLAYVLYAEGKSAEAVPVFRRLFELTREGRISGSPAKNGAYLALTLRKCGDADEAAKAAAGQTKEAAGFLDRARTIGGKDSYTLMDIAELSALLGQRAEAMETLKKAQKAGFMDYFFPVILPGFQPIAGEPEFRALFKLEK